MSELININNTNITKYTSLQQIEKKYHITFAKRYYDVENIVLEIFNINGCSSSDNCSSNSDSDNDGGSCNSSDNDISDDSNNKTNFKNYDLHNTLILNAIGIYYRYVIKNYNKMKKYFLMAINLKCAHAMFNLAHYYQETEKNYDKMKKWFLKAIDLKYSDAMNSLGLYYGYFEKNKDLMIYYLLMAIELNNLNAFDNIKKYRTNVELFLILKHMKNKDDKFMEIYKEIQNETSVRYFINNKICDELFKNNVQICSICYENKIHVKLDNCNHYVCNICYLNVSECHQCLKYKKCKYKCKHKYKYISINTHS